MNDNVKIILKVLIILFVACFGFSCHTINYLCRFGLKGNVKCFVEQHYDVKFENNEWVAGELKYYGHNRITFDKHGKYVLNESLDFDGQGIGKVIPKYIGEMIVQEVAVDKNDDTLEITKITKLSNHENALSIYDKSHRKLGQGKSIFKNNRVQKTIVIDSVDNKIIRTTLYKYDSKNNLVQEKLVGKNGDIEFFAKLKYVEFDTHNNWTKCLFYKSNDVQKPSLIFKRTIEYFK